MKRIFLLFLLANFQAFSQTIYLPHEVEKTAEPSGGLPYLEDGSLCEYKVDKSAGRDLDSEALRVVKKMNGLWEPGAMRGKSVRVKYNLPIDFEMN